ncbi:MAG: GlsB/YeaQ/YmgE family stress response membrane protein [Bradymonadales bacterium]|nr:MAG: GlsB/YeaQ/YmgE family stress response membrane protein [Bradymonadales bacterium]
MAFIWTIILGLFIGLVARLLMPGKTVQGFIMTALLGVGGAVVGKWIGQAFGWYGPYDAAGFLMGVLGAMLILFVYRLLQALKESD